jgi:hypothetical protein
MIDGRCFIVARSASENHPRADYKADWLRFFDAIKPVLLLNFGAKHSLVTLFADLCESLTQILHRVYLW